MRSHRNILPLLRPGALALLMFACSEPVGPRSGPLGAPTPVGYAISDAMHAGGNRHVFFLPPVVGAPGTSNGKFDPNVAAEVDICELTSAGCLAPYVAHFTRGSVSGSDAIRVDGEQYIVNWHTNDSPLSANKIYRIRLRVLNTILGFADVQVFPNASQAKNAVTGETFALVDGRTLPIKFRIEEGAAFVFPAGGGKAATPDGKVTMEMAADALREPIALTVEAAAVKVLDEGLISGAVYEFGPSGTQFDKPIKVSIKFVPENIPFGMDESKVRLHTVSTGVDGHPFWEEVKASTVDLETHTVSGYMEHFSPGGAKVQTAVSTVSVNPVPPGSMFGTRSFTIYVYPRDATGNFLTGRSVTAASSAPGVLTTSAVTEILAGANPSCPTGCYSATVTATDVAQTGTSTVTITSEAKTTTFAVTVNPLPIQTVKITPLQPDKSISLRMYETAQLKVTLVDVDGRTVTNRQLTWTGGGTVARAVPVDPAGYTLNVEGLDRGLTNLGVAIQGSTAVGSATVKVSSAPAATLRLIPDAQSILFGMVAHVDVEAFDARNVRIPDAPITWTIADPTVARLVPNVNGGDDFEAVAHDGGTTVITATSEGVTATGRIIVQPEPVRTISLAPSPVTVVERGSSPVSVVLKGASGAVLSGRAITVNTDDAQIAAATTGPAVSVTGVAPGGTTLRVSSEGITGSAPVSVTPLRVDLIVIDPATPQVEVGSTTNFTMTAFNASLPLKNRTATWTSDNQAIATVDPVTGVLRALHVGEALITASVANAGGAPTTRTVLVGVYPSYVETFLVDPADLTVFIDEPKQFSFKGLDHQGNVVNGLNYDFYSSRADQLAFFGNRGPNPTFVRSTTGEVEVRGFYEGAVPVIVALPGPTGPGSGYNLTLRVKTRVDHVTVTPTNPVIGIGQHVQLSVAQYDGAGGALSYPVAYQYSDPRTVSVSPTGLVTGLSEGTMDIVANVHGKTATTTVTVAKVATVSVTRVPPIRDPVTVRDLVQYQVDVQSATGLVLQGRSIQWTTSDPTVATVNATGLVTPLKPGRVDIRATSEGVIGSSTLDILNWEPVTSLFPQPGSLTLAELSSVPLSVIATGPSGAEHNDRIINWSGVPGLVSLSGFPMTGPEISVTGISPGSGQIRVQSEESPTKLIPFTVTALFPDRYDVFPENPTVAVGKTTPFSFTLYNDDRPLPGRRVQWGVINGTGVVNQDSPGVLRGYRMGTVQLVGDFFVDRTNEYQGRKIITVNVVAPPIQRLEFFPLNLLYVGEPISFALRAIGLDNSYIAGLNFDITSADPSCLTLSGQNIGAGTVRLPADGGGVNATVTAAALKVCNTTLTARVSGSDVTLDLPVAVRTPVRSLTFAPVSPSLVPGASVQLTTTILSVFGPNPISYPVTWSVEDPGVAQVSAAGVVTAVGVGQTKVFATSRGFRAENVVTVAQPSVVEISTSTPSITYTQSAGYSALIKASNGSPLIGAHVDWTTSDPDIATVDANGYVTAHGVGTVTITGTSDGVSGSSDLEVTVRWLMSTREYPNTALHENEYLQSRNGQYWLVMQADCNLVLYRGPAGDWSQATAVWGSGTQNANISFVGFKLVRVPCMAVMQGDGNFVIYKTYNPHFTNAIVGTGVRGPGEYHIAVEDDGRITGFDGPDQFHRGAMWMSHP